MSRIDVVALFAVLLLSPPLLPAAHAQACSGSTVDDNNPQMAASSRAFVQHLQALVHADDRNALASLVSYPLRVYRGPGSKSVIRTKADFLAHYDSIITPKVKAAIDDKDSVRCLFYNSNGFMIGNGEIWFDGNTADTLKIISMNL